MEDSQIIDLYWMRDETAIAETDQKYGTFCRRIALNVLSLPEDAEECVNDTWLRAWNAMPPQRPERLRAWLGRIVRNLSLDLWNHSHRQKRYAGMDVLLSELEECLPAPRTVESTIEDQELGRVISNWLRTLPQEDRVLFVLRYWNGTPLNKLAGERKLPAAKLAQRMYRLRLSLKAALEKEGIAL